MGRAGRQRGSLDVQAARAGPSADEDGRVPRVVSRAPPPAAGLEILRHRVCGWRAKLARKKSRRGGDDRKVLSVWRAGHNSVLVFDTRAWSHTTSVMP